VLVFVTFTFWWRSGGNVVVNYDSNLYCNITQKWFQSLVVF